MLPRDATHPLDCPNFRAWMRDKLNDIDLIELNYGIYDSGWWSVYEMFQDDVEAGEWEIETS